MFNKNNSNSASSFRSQRPGHSARGSFHGRPQGHSFGGGAPRGNRFGGNSRGRFNGGMRGDRIDPARFINKSVITEEAEHFVPEHQFKDFKIDESIKGAIVVKGYTLPTPIQDKAIPHVLMGQDIVGIANTGTGKTGAFLIPMIQKVRLNPKEKILILAPTRELAIQIDQELKEFTRAIKSGVRVFSVCCVGGANIMRQISELRYPHNFIIGTPGRLKDLVERKRINLAEFGTIVLDEADRMLDMGFINDMRFVMERMLKNRQTLFFSATLSPTIEKLIKEFLKEPVRISVKTRDTSKNVEQDVIRVMRGTNKLDVLHELLNKEEFSKVLIFGRTKHGVEKLSKELEKRGFKAESIHGNKNHSKRQRALSLFKDNHTQILVATDVAARGLDIADVSHVINFDLPATYEDYVHRIGRTGRADKRGKALTFIE